MISNYRIIKYYRGIYDLLMIFFQFYLHEKLGNETRKIFLMSTAIVLLVKDGPINTLEQNVQQVAQSLTCMYEQVRGCTLHVSLCVLMYIM